MGRNYDLTHIALMVSAGNGETITFVTNGQIICVPVQMQNTSADGHFMAEVMTHSNVCFGKNFL
jgi:hypothetical protein